MKYAKLSASLICTTILVIFAIFVWPTKYKYITYGNGLLVRIDRFTQKVERLDIREGWITIERKGVLDEIIERKSIFDDIRNPSPSPSVKN